MPRVSRAMSEDEKRWRRESDAEAIKRYHEIMSDKMRSKEATNHLKMQADMLNKVIKNTKRK